MRPFRMFFGLSLAIMLFFVVAKFFVFAFIVATIMSIVYAVFRRLKDFITYDRFGEYYIKGYNHQAQVQTSWNQETEPLFYGAGQGYQYRNREQVHFVTIQ